MQARITQLLLSLLLSFSAFAAQGQEHAGATFDFTRRPPLEFVEFLKKNQDRRNTYTVREHYRGWINADDIPRLLELLDSEEPCMGVMYGASSYIPGASTVGDQAGFMILAYQKGYYPPSLFTTKLSNADKQMLRSWWKIYQESTPVGKR